MIEFDGVTKTYADGTVAVTDVSLTIPARTTTVLVGTSGSGKTTLLRMVNRMVDPTRGHVRIDGQDVADADPVQLRRSIGYVMQSSGLLPHRTVIDNIATVPILQGVRRGVARENARELLALVGLDSSLAEKYPHQLSGGQQQRVGVARALAPDPNILLMDEPFGAVDPIVRADLQVEVQRVVRELKKTVVFVTHDISEALLLGDQIAILREGGVLVQVATPREIIEYPADDFVRQFVGLDRAPHLTRLSAHSSILVDEYGRPVGVWES